MTYIPINIGATPNDKAGDSPRVVGQKINDGFAGLPAEYAKLDTTPTLTGVEFPASQVPSAGPNTLDDYEEGTWVPVLSFGGASVGITYSIQEGRYTKIGNRVMFEMAMLLSSKGTSVGSANITLPFVPANFFPTTSHEASVSIGFATDVGTIVRAGVFQQFIIFFDSTTSNITGMTDTEFTNTTNIRVSGTYGT